MYECMNLYYLGNFNENKEQNTFPIVHSRNGSVGESHIIYYYYSSQLIFFMTINISAIKQLYVVFEYAYVSTLFHKFYKKIVSWLPVFSISHFFIHSRSIQMLFVYFLWLVIPFGDGVDFGNI